MPTSAKTTRQKLTPLRLVLAATILSLYLALLVVAGSMFVTKDFLSDFFWITIGYGAVMCPLNIWLARTTQRRFYRRIHRLVYADEELTLAPGELPAARRSVIKLPWVASIRDCVAWVLANYVYFYFLLRWATVSQNLDLDTSPQFWFNAFAWATFCFAPLVLMAALLAYSAATNSYVQFFFRQGEYEQYIAALTPVRRRYIYMGLVGYTFLVIILAIHCKFISHRFANIDQAFTSLRETETCGAGLLVIICSLLFLLSLQEKRVRKLPLMLERKASAASKKDKCCPKCGIEVGSGMDVCPQDGTLLSFSEDERASLGSSYEFLEEIARGGMSVIYKARHRLTSKVVAIKVMDTRTGTDFQAAQRFVNEAKASMRLDHPNIISVHDIGEFESTKLFMVMEYLPGSTLAQMIQKPVEALPVRDCLMIFDQVCDAMAYAHDNKVLHRDLKPGNIMVCKQDVSYRKYTVKVLDFGIAKVLEGTAANLTKSGDVFGTPGYMSPEQCLGHKLQVQSDVYSMGCLMYETLTGEAPAVGENVLATMYKQINEVPAPLAEKRPELQSIAGLEAVINKAMAKNPEQRYANFSSLRSALQSISAKLVSASQRN